MGWQEKTITNRRGLKLAARLRAAESVDGCLLYTSVYSRQRKLHIESFDYS